MVHAPIVCGSWLDSTTFGLLGTDDLKQTWYIPRCGYLWMRRISRTTHNNVTKTEPITLYSNLDNVIKITNNAL